MYDELVRIYRAIERRLKDPAQNEMSIPRMFWHYVTRRAQAWSQRRASVEVPLRVVPGLVAPGRIAVILHCHDTDLLDELVDYVSRIPQPYRLYVSTNTEDKRRRLQERLAELEVANFEVRLTTNRGRDMAAKYITFRDIYAECDYFVHLHDKKSPHLGAGWAGRWRRYLFETLLGSPEIVRSILALLGDARVGLVFPAPFDPTTPGLRWGSNFKVCLALARRLGIEISEDNCPEYPSGGMFWAKAGIAGPLLDLNLRFEDFPPEEGQLDGGLNHAIERMIVPVANAQGKRAVVITRRDGSSGGQPANAVEEDEVSAIVTKYLVSEDAWSRNARRSSGDRNQDR